jgi:anhydro-N-acetylmuramic acid kinase
MTRACSIGAASGKEAEFSIMLAIGLMSGTSRDGIDAALIETDGEGQAEAIIFHAQPYSDDFRERLAAACARAMAMDAPGEDPLIRAVEMDLTNFHIDAIADMLGRSGHVAEDIGVIGFHGHTVAHRPERRWTWQIGDGAVLAGAFGIPVVADLRSADVRAGGQGAPLMPVYHRALSDGLAKPVGILNLGGVANITAIGSDGGLVAFDTGMASGLIDNWMQAHGDAAYDARGAAGGDDGRSLVRSAAAQEHRPRGLHHRAGRGTVAGGWGGDADRLFRAGGGARCRPSARAAGAHLCGGRRAS